VYKRQPETLCAFTPIKTTGVKAMMRPVFLNRFMILGFYYKTIDQINCFGHRNHVL
jgi:hypothetical protein